MSALTKTKKYTPEEYLALEEKAEYRSEYENGLIVAMAGGSLNHQQITANMTVFLDSQIRRNGCRVLPTEMKIRVEAVNKFYYPDVTIICEKPEFYGKRSDTITNPRLLIEVLSKSTEAKDRGEKFFAYQTLDSFEEYVLVSQDKHLVETFTKQTDGSWRYLATIGLDSKVYLDSVKAELTMQEIYDLVEFEQGNL
ncbi:MAG TPA: Uma2 family endonuclease [Pyrinomonadaceae bacterium]|jgi:Uma2 family endonuclease